MEHISVSKQGEVLIMKKMGFTHPSVIPSSKERRTFDAFFDKNMMDQEVEAMDELFPTTKTKASRVSHRSIAVVA